MKECPLCHMKYRDDDFYCKRDNRRLITIENSEKIYFDSFEKMAKEHQKALNNPLYKIITCPYCHSTNTHKISGLSKAGSVAILGVFAMGKVSKQWHCNNCKSDF